MSDDDLKHELETIEEKERRDLAFVSLRKHIDQKTYGDRITAEEIIETTGFEQWRSFCPRIRRYMRSRGHYLQPVPNDGYRILLPHEHVDYAERQRRSALRKEVLGLGATESTPVKELDERQLRRWEFVRARQHKRVGLAQEHEKETRKALGTRSDRVPLLPGGGGEED